MNFYRFKIGVNIIEFMNKFVSKRSEVVNICQDSANVSNNQIIEVYGNGEWYILRPDGQYMRIDEFSDLDENNFIKKQTQIRHIFKKSKKLNVRTIRMIEIVTSNNFHDYLVMINHKDDPDSKQICYNMIIKDWLVEVDSYDVYDFFLNKIGLSAIKNAVSSEINSMPNTNEFYRIINNPGLNMDNVTRFSGQFQIEPEKLPVHIVDVQFISYMIGLNFIKRGEDVNLGELALKGLIHDMDEVLVGDIPRLTKYSSKQCHDLLSEVSKDAMKSISNDIDGTDNTFRFWNEAKNDTIEGYILTIADMISVAKKAIKEVDTLGNKSFLKIIIEMSNYIEDLKRTIPSRLGLSCFEYMEKLLKDVQVSLDYQLDQNRDYVERHDVIDKAVKIILDDRYVDNNVEKVRDD